MNEHHWFPVDDKDIPDSARKVEEVGSDGEPVKKVKAKAAPKAKKTAKQRLAEAEAEDDEAKPKKKVSSTHWFPARRFVY